MDVWDLDEVGFAMTLPTNYSWSAVGGRLTIPYEAPQGRRVNGIGAYCSAGPEAGRLEYRLRVNLPKPRKSKKGSPCGKTAPEGKAEALGERGTPEAVGPIDSDLFLEFIWTQVAGRPADAAAGWRCERPCVIVLDNYSMHKSQKVQDALPALEAADIYLFYLPSYSPELSEIEPIWRAVKYYELPKRSYTDVWELKQAVEAALARKAQSLRRDNFKTDNLLQQAA